MNSYARGHELLHKAGEILQTRHIPQSLSRDLKHKAADTTLWIRQVLNHLHQTSGRWKSHFRAPFFLLSSLGICRGQLWKPRCCTGGPQVRHFSLPCSSAWKKMLPKGLRVVTEQWCCFGAIWSSSSPCYQGSCSRGTCTLSSSCCNCPGTNLSPPACTRHPGGKCSAITPLPCQGNHCCHQKLAATFLSANKGLLPSSWAVLLIPRTTECWIMFPFGFFKWSLWATRFSKMRNPDILGCSIVSVLFSEGSSQRLLLLASLRVFQGRN